MLHIDGVEFSWPGTGPSTGPSTRGGAVHFRFDLTVPSGTPASPGRITMIQGASGVGKSTLLNLIAGLLTPAVGRIFWQGVDISALPPHMRPLSILFQDHNLFGHLTCVENIALGIDPGLKLPPSGWHAVEDALARLGIGGMGERLPDTLSGGQQQRVALARALLRARMQKRSLLLLDEPFSALDPETRDECSRITRQLVEDENLTALVVSHDPTDKDRLNADVFALSGQAPRP